MQFSRNQIGIAAGAGLLLLIVFFGYLIHLNGQGPVLGRSEERDPLSGIPNSISLNPLRDRASEREAAKFIRNMRDGKCKDAMAGWAKDYRKKYAAFICDSEAQHPLLSWEVADWEDAPPLRILHYPLILIVNRQSSLRGESGRRRLLPARSQNSEEQDLCHECGSAVEQYVVQSAGTLGKVGLMPLV
jgi:hypothetical protein